MPDQPEHHEHYEELAAYTSRRAALPSADQVRSAGTRRLHRRRFGQAAAAAGTLAVVGTLAVTLPGASSPTTTLGAAAAAASTSPSAAAGTAAGVSAAGVTASAGAPGAYASAAPSACPGGFGRGTEYVITLADSDYLATAKGTNGSPDIYGLGFKGSDVASSLSMLGFRVEIEREHSRVPAGEIVAITNPQQVNEMGTDVSPAEDTLVLHISLGA